MDTLNRGMLQSVEGGLKSHTRRPHRKTKTGCLSCKRRKIKCDEMRPRCSNCIKHSLVCEYAPKKEIRSSIVLLSNDNLENINLLDLELLHFFCTTTSLTYQHRRVMSINVPQLGFSYDFVMHGILAAAGLHLAKTMPERKDICLSRAMLHHQLGLTKASKLLSELDHENASALYIFSALTLLYTLASTALYSSGGFLLTSDSGIAQWIILSRQSFSIVKIAGAALRTGPIGAIFNTGRRRAALQAEYTPSPEAVSVLSRLSALIAQTTPNPKHKAGYDLAISELLKVYGVVEGMTRMNEHIETSDIFIWPFKLSETYLDLLQQPTQEALVILAYFAVMPSRFRAHWFLADFSIHLISRIYPMIDHNHLSWIDWPIQQIGWKPDLGYSSSNTALL